MSHRLCTKYWSGAGMERHFLSCWKCYISRGIFIFLLWNFLKKYLKSLGKIDFIDAVESSQMSFECLRGKHQKKIPFENAYNMWKKIKYNSIIIVSGSVQFNFNASFFSVLIKILWNTYSCNYHAEWKLRHRKMKQLGECYGKLVVEPRSVWSESCNPNHRWVSKSIHAF